MIHCLGDKERVVDYNSEGSKSTIVSFTGIIGVMILYSIEMSLEGFFEALPITYSIIVRLR